MNDSSILVGIALVSALLVFRDARRHVIDRPGAWAAAVFLFWIVGLPAYLCRRRSGRQR